MNSLKIDWKKMNGLVPAIIQNAETKEVLMLGYQNEEAVEETLKQEKLVFYSRSKQRLWVKGESSGNYLRLVKVFLDCDEDALYYQVIPAGPTCHKGNRSCFIDFDIRKLEDIINKRQGEDPEKSYTAKLLSRHEDELYRKLPEEAVEVLLAAKGKDKQQVLEESADLVFHHMVLLKSLDLEWDQVLSVLQKRYEKTVS